MEREIKFYYFPNNTYIITNFVENSSLNDYTIFLQDNNIYIPTVHFIQNCKILNTEAIIQDINNIIIVPKNFFKINAIFPINFFKSNNYTNNQTNNTNNQTNNNTNNNEILNNESNSNNESSINNESNSNNESSINNESNSKIDIDDITSKYLNLLQKYPDLISFIIILKTDIIDYITLYLEKYKKKKIYNIIRNNQHEIINMLETNKSFINFYIRTCNVNVLSSLLNYSYNSIIISQIENIFPDVPVENIEELIEIFS